MPPSWEQSWLDDSPAFNPPESEADAARAHAEMVLAKRQAPTGMIQIPGCVTGCMAAANVGQCTSNFDYLCLCISKTYQQAVMHCWAVRCNASSYETALAYSTAACAALGSNLDPGENGATSDLTMGPVIYSRAAFTLQAVMSSVCSFVLVCALTLGLLRCRSQARKQSFMTAATAGTGTMGNKSRLSRMPRSYFPGREEGQISTVDMGGSVDFSEMFKVPPRRPLPQRNLGQPKFTNRLPTERSEEWEMGRVASREGDNDLGEGSSMSPSASGSGSGSGEGKGEAGEVGHGIIAKDHYENRSSIRFSLASSRKGVLGEYTAPSIESGSEARCGETLVTHASSTAALNPHPLERTDSTASTPETPSTVYMRAADTPLPASTPSTPVPTPTPSTPTPMSFGSAAHTPTAPTPTTPTPPEGSRTPTSPTSPRPFASYHRTP